MTLQDLLVRKSFVKQEYQAGKASIGRSIDYMVDCLTSYYTDNIGSEADKDKKIALLQTESGLIGIIEYLKGK